MITFKKREIIYRPYEAVIKIIADLVVIVCAAFLMITFLFDNTTVSGHSMNNTLQNGDVVLVNKAVYQFRDPQRFDVVVFKPNIGNVSQYYIKRIIGLPGETVQIKDGKIYIDGSLLGNDVTDTVIYNGGSATEPVKLGYDEYFVLGDNRNNSDDSRFGNVGPVKRETIIGMPWLIVYPFSDFGVIETKALSTSDENPTEQK
ncbi:MAG: signal peptidase I [Butyrivibrio sp.]